MENLTKTMSVKVKKSAYFPMFFTGENLKETIPAKSGKIYTFNCGDSLLPIIPAVFVSSRKLSESAANAVSDAADKYFSAFSAGPESFEDRLVKVSDFLNKRLTLTVSDKNYAGFTVPECMKSAPTETVTVLSAYVLRLADCSADVKLSDGVIKIEFEPSGDCTGDIISMVDACRDLGIRIEYKFSKICKVVIYPYITDKLTSNDFKNRCNVEYDV